MNSDSSSPSTPTSEYDDPYGDVEGDEERIKVRRLLMWVGAFMAFPGLSIGFSFILFDPADHVGHISLSLMFGFAGIFLALASRRIAYKYA